MSTAFDVRETTKLEGLYEQAFPSGKAMQVEAVNVFFREIHRLETDVFPRNLTIKLSVEQWALDALDKSTGPMQQLMFRSLLFRLTLAERYFDSLIADVSSGQFTLDERYFLFWQAYCRLFMYRQFDTPERRLKLHGLYRQLYLEIRNYFPPFLFNKKLARKNTDTIVVLTNQLLGISHAPTRVCMEYCRFLKEELGKRVVLINTADLPRHNNLPFYGYRAARYVPEHSAQNILPYKETQIEFHQFTEPMPAFTSMENILELLTELDPGFVLSLGGASLMGDLLGEITQVVAMNYSLDFPIAVNGLRVLQGEDNPDSKALRTALGFDETQLIHVPAYCIAPEASERVLSREELALPADRFVIALVGNRLEAELDEAFLAMLEQWVQQEPRLHFALIGFFEKHALVENHFPTLHQHVSYLAYQPDLMAVYPACDLNTAWGTDDDDLHDRPLSITVSAEDNVRIYDEVWKLINSRFLDPNKNGQDWLIWRHRYDDKIQTEQDTTVAVRSMLDSLNDPYTRFLDTEEFGEEGRSIKALLYGIGIQIGSQNDRVVVISPIEDTPAEKAGLKAGDLILEIDGKSTQGMSVKDAANMIRGQKGTAVSLVIQQGAKKQPRNYSIMRDEIKLKSVSEKPPLDLQTNVGYIRLSSFLSETASDEFRAAIGRQADKAGYIVDIRSNPGGLLKNAIQIADMFLDKGAIVSTVDRDGYKETLFSTSGTLSSKPLVLLINGGSASASEILSGALRDNNRAVLVGKKSFGKGLVQEINSLPHGAGVNITTQKYLTPNDTDINKVGILPDIEVDMPELKDEDQYDVKKHGDPQLLAGQSALLDLISGKSLNYLQNRSLVETSSLKPEAAASDKAAEPKGLESIKAPLKVR